MYGFWADVVLVIHFIFILFVVGGQTVILLGGFRRWRWVRNPVFRLSHLIAIGVVTAQAWAGRWCFLTVWESRLRELSGDQGYNDSFIRHWIGGLIFYDAPVMVFTWIYTGFAVIVVLSWVWVRPVSGRQGKMKQKEADR